MTKQQANTNHVAVDVDFPPLPKAPTKYSPDELARYQQQLDSWYFQFRASLLNKLENFAREIELLKAR